MSDYASLEPSRELAELSGWDDTGREYFTGGSEVFIVPVYGPTPESKDFIPAYDAGYLLRKLPNEATSKKHGGYHYLYVHHGKNDWYAYYGEIDTTELMASGDTPEDALANLAIELHKAGILPISGRD